MGGGRRRSWRVGRGPSTSQGGSAYDLVAADTDFVARRVGVHPDGLAINLADGIIRLSERDRYPRPGRPRSSAVSVVTPGQPYALSIDLQATAAMFLAGHRIRVDITSSSHPRWIRHTNTAAPPLDATELVVAAQQVWNDPEHPSRVHLTVLADPAAVVGQRVVTQPATTSPIRPGGGRGCPARSGRTDSGTCAGWRPGRRSRS